MKRAGRSSPPKSPRGGRRATANSAGAAALRALDVTQREVAAKIGVSAQRVGRWSTGERVPAAAERKKLAKHFAIAEDAWEKPAPEPPAPADVVVPTLSDGTFEAQTQRLFGEVEYLRVRAEWYRAQNNGRMYLATLREATAMHQSLGKMLGTTLEITEARAAKLPAVRRLLERIAHALRPWPDAMKAARDAIVVH